MAPKKKGVGPASPARAASNVVVGISRKKSGDVDQKEETAPVLDEKEEVQHTAREVSAGLSSDQDGEHLQDAKSKSSSTTAETKIADAESAKGSVSGATTAGSCDASTRDLDLVATSEVVPWVHAYPIRE
jgi:hypothetical protein